MKIKNENKFSKIFFSSNFKNDIVRDVLVLIGLTVGFRIIAYFILKLKSLRL